MPACAGVLLLCLFRTDHINQNMENLIQQTATGTLQAPVVKKDLHLSPLLLWGYAILAASLILFIAWDLLPDKGSRDDDGALTVFAIHYALMLSYVFILSSHGAFGLMTCWRKENLDTTVVLVNLALVSAFALNRCIPVFEKSVGWLCGYLVVSSATLLSYKFSRVLPKPLRFLQHFLLGAAVVLYIYLTIYTLPAYVVGGVGMILLGVGGHIFVPLAMTTACVYIYIHHHRRISKGWLMGGVTTVVFFAIGFVLEWNGRATKMEHVVNQSVLSPDMDLPVWVKLAQTLKRDWISMRLLKSDLVYTSPWRGSDWDFGLGRRSWNEARKHDPLVLISSFSREVPLSHEDRIKALQAISDSRHPGNERLWPGDNLTTSYIVSDVDIYPALRLAYTEKYLNIHNSGNDNWRRNREEAIYTFQLPEGAVITSLSLWIGGEERKGILTSKGKATEAYQSVVGIFARDPSVVHWQEGNTVTVRVFPCPPAEERKVKIGITSPLVQRDGQLYYRNMTFQGPSAASARETYRVRFPGYNGAMDMPRGFTRLANGDFLAEGDYDADFALAFPLEAVPENHFSFDGYTYVLTEYKQNHAPARWKRVYLDINSAWTQTEAYQLKSILKNLEVYAYQDGAAIKLDESSWDEVTGNMREQNFSLFPIHHIKDKAHTLVVTKGSALSPHLSDFSESAFAWSIRAAMGEGEKVKVFNLDGGVSTYISSLREFRGIAFAKGNVAALMDMLSRGVFPADAETDNRIVLHDAGLVLTRTQTGKAAPAVSNAPDHLARLFAYNNIMRKVGTRFYDNDFVNQDLVDEAAKAYVVSPVSSLIVLETQADYEKYGIKDTENSLHNASKDESGAVPEPHEWALIIMFALFVLYTVRRRYFFKTVS
jgi:XrtN system VIT domain protein